jgi:hypothetical protein
MGIRLRHLSIVRIAVLAATMLIAVGPVSANPVESQDNSQQSELERLAARLKAKSERAIAVASQAAARAVEASKDAIAETQTDLGPRLETFRKMLNAQKAKLATLGEDAAARFDAWKQAATKSWSETWNETWNKTWNETWTESWGETWTDSWAELHRSAQEAVDWLRDWIEKQSGPDAQTETPV